MANYTNQGKLISRFCIIADKDVAIWVDMTTPDSVAFCYIGNAKFLSTDHGKEWILRKARDQKADFGTRYFVPCSHGKHTMVSPVGWNDLTEFQKEQFERYCDIP